ncbi:uncharacterized protein LOC128683905 [Plodia interpunctella]|uniref:uncharacterized protein LOC128683905 n=1 Tax=Plodia interpunctella TaxID=58824 RepID=UPI002368BA56|nr:uncharacterized protein LOC128683905 [Plodia interpunctella]
MAGKQLVKMGVVPKTSVNISSVVRQASCSRGWLRIVVQYFFGAITVASFIMIVIISMQTPSETAVSSSSCTLQTCRITCNSTPTLYEDVMSMVSESEAFCPRLSLVLMDLTFEKSTLPSQWFSGIKSSVNRLAILNGNLKYISSQAFMTLFAGNIEAIIFEGITLENWNTESLVGLSSLRQLFIKNCDIINAQNFLRTVHDTLGLLIISKCGNWDPANVFGSTEMIALETVDLSFNIFNNILSNVSFTSLTNCKILYLNSCNITSLGPGTFDSLHKIEVIYLNNNLLVTIPTGLFNPMINRINPKPRINLQDNPWYCDCLSYDLRSLYYNDLLYVDPLCDTPEALNGQPFSAISDFCTDGELHADVVVVDLVPFQKYTTANVFTRFESDCKSEIPFNSSGEIFTPNDLYSCENFSLSLSTINTLIGITRGKVIHDISKSNWITPTYLMRHKDYSMIQISTLSANENGILWFKNSCPKEIYCMSSLPKFLRIYDHYIGSLYTFCPIDLQHGYVRVDKCVDYNSVTISLETNTRINLFGSIVLYISTVMLCLTIGAIFVYGVIRYNPILLKGSKRLLFVKHKNVDALVLPPKVPLRTTLSSVDPDPIFNMATIHSPLENENNLSPRNFVRMKSTRSDMSTVSYISALQPTEDQLAEWRIKRHFDNNITMTSDSEMSIFSYTTDGNSSAEYVSTSSIIYESLK